MSRRDTWAVAPELRDRSADLVRGGFVADVHTHPRGVVPEPLRRALEASVGVPKDPLSNLPRGHVDLVVCTAVGDAIGTLHRPGGSWRAVLAQLDQVRVESARGGLDVLTEGVVRDPSRTQVLLGVEGGDVIGDDLDAIDRLHEHGVRSIGLVHYADNAIGTISTSVTGRRGSRAVRRGRRDAGLTPFGRRVVERMNELEMTIDLAHADLETTLDVCAVTRAPVMSSHTACSQVRPFPRYVSNAEIEAIASTGGVVGLWPISLRSSAMLDLDDFGRHAAHLAETVGTQHIAIGTDKNGVVSYADGYRGSHDLPRLAAALLGHGFTDDETRAALGENALALLARTHDTPRHRDEGART